MGYEFFRRTLRTGNNLVGLIEKGSPAFLLSVATPFGALNTQGDCWGAAHFTEHILFKNQSDPNKKQAYHALKTAGGISNGGTSFSWTELHTEGRIDRLEQGVKFLTSLLGMPNCNPSRFVQEREVIDTERSESRDNPKDMQPELSFYSLYYPSIPQSIFGSKSLFNRIKLKDVLDVWKTGFSLENLNSY